MNICYVQREERRQGFTQSQQYRLVHEGCCVSFLADRRCVSCYFTGSGFPFPSALAAHPSCKRRRHRPNHSSSRPRYTTCPWQSSQHERTNGTLLGDDPATKAVLPHGVRGAESGLRGRGPLPSRKLCSLLPGRAGLQAPGSAPPGWFPAMDMPYVGNGSCCSRCCRIRAPL